MQIPWKERVKRHEELIDFLAPRLKVPDYSVKLNTTNNDAELCYIVIDHIKLFFNHDFSKLSMLYTAKLGERKHQEFLCDSNGKLHANTMAAVARKVCSELNNIEGLRGTTDTTAHFAKTLRDNLGEEFRVNVYLDMKPGTACVENGSFILPIACHDWYTKLPVHTYGVTAKIYFKSDKASAAIAILKELTELLPIKVEFEQNIHPSMPERKKGND